jgi:FkbM family methyltransferase
VSRRLARAITRTAPVRRVDWVAYALIGHPRGRDVAVTAKRYGARFELHLGDDVDRLLYLDTYERLALKDVLALVRPDDVVIDIGANVGLYSLAAAAKGAQVHAFEPVPATAARLEASLALNPEFSDRVTVHAEGLSDEPGSLTLFTESLEGYSGHASAHLATEAQVESIEVPMDTLDTAMADLSGPVRLVKVDVEGHEPAVLDGGVAFFERVRPEFLFVEIEEDHLARAGSSGAAFYQRILDLGYEAQGGYTLHHGLWPYTKPSHDPPPFPAGKGQSVLFRAR